MLSVEGISVRYANGALGISGVSLEVADHQVVAAFGPNGAGKTTLVRSISGFLRSERARVVEGRIRVGDIETTNREPHELYRLGVAFVPERNKVFPNLSVRENLHATAKLPPRARRGEVLDRIHDLFPVLKERPGELAGRLSGGQQQMVALARALMGEPRLLIVDEMTLGLHHSLQLPLFQAVKAIAATGTSVLMVEESTGLALQLADHCYQLGDGMLVRSGPPESFAGHELEASGFVEE